MSEATSQKNKTSFFKKTVKNIFVFAKGKINKHKYTHG